jgi:metallo-beta-lactamase family protein
MKLSFHGAARTVTGTKHMLTLENQKKYLLDCGMFQGMGAETDGLNSDFGFDAREIYALFLSHAHIDHSGLIPKLVKEGFSGKIYCTQPTKDLSEILLYDSAEIQAYEADYINKKRGLANGDAQKVLYAVEDVVAALGLFEIIEYDQWIKIDEDVEVMYTNAGHLIGSAAINVKAHERRQNNSITFSGDVGDTEALYFSRPQSSQAIILSWKAPTAIKCMTLDLHY